MGELAAGIISGIALSLGVWTFKFHLLRPQLKFSEAVGRIPYGTQSDYRIKIANHGWRPIVDVRVDCVVVIPRLDPAYSNAAIFRVAVSTETIAVLGKGRRRRPRIRLITLGEGGLTPFALERLRRLDPSPLPKNAEPTLEDLVSLRTGAHLRIRIIGHDGLTGAPAVFESPKYDLSRIKPGRFKKGSLDLAVSA